MKRTLNCFLRAQLEGSQFHNLVFLGQSVMLSNNERQPKLLQRMEYYNQYETSWWSRAKKARRLEFSDCFQQVSGRTTTKEAGFFQEHCLGSLVVFINPGSHTFLFWLPWTTVFLFNSLVLTQRKIFYMQWTRTTLFLSSFVRKQWKILVISGSRVRLLPNICLLSCKNMLLTFFIRITCGITLCCDTEYHSSG